MGVGCHVFVISGSPPALAVARLHDGERTATGARHWLAYEYERQEIPARVESPSESRASATALPLGVGATIRLNEPPANPGGQRTWSSPEGVGAGLGLEP